MRAIGNVIVEDELFERAFVCELEACKGACCVEGSGGAPLLPEEVQVLENIRGALAPYLSPEGWAELEAQGVAVFADGEYETPLIGSEGPCAYVTYTPNGTARCGIEEAYRDGAVAFQKPISCHLYPIRTYTTGPVEMLYYHRWHICHKACGNGAALGVPVFRFCRSALERKYGPEFYQALEAEAAKRSTPPVP